jgi:hypothetical protein
MKQKKRIAVILFFLLLLVGGLLRFYNLKKNVDFGWDQERAAIAILEMLRSKKPFLIGPRVGPAKFFLGPLYYYLATPFLLITKLDPIGLYYCSVLIGEATAIFIYYLGKQIFNRKIAFLSLMIYCLSPFFVIYDRIPWNVNFLIFSSLLTFFAIFKTFLRNKETIFNYVLLGLGIGLGIHSHLTSVFLLAILLFFILIKKKLSLKLGVSFLIIFLFLLPLIVFDFRHDFFNLKAVLEFLNTNSEYPTALSFKQRVFKNLVACLELPGKIFLTDGYYWLGLFPGIILLIYLLKRAFLDKIDRGKYQTMLSYLFLPLALLGFYRGEIPEYYFFLQVPVLIFLIADFLTEEIDIFSHVKKLGFLALFFLFLTLQGLPPIKNINEASLFYKEKVIDYILSSAGKRSFKVSYLMNRGRDVGFNYFLKLKNQELDDKANLEFSVIYPIYSEIRKGDYKIIGSFGVKAKEASFDDFFRDYFNRDYLFAFNLPKGLMVIDCSFNNSYKEFTVVDEKQGSCSESSLEGESVIRFLTGNDQELFSLYNDFGGRKERRGRIEFKERRGKRDGEEREEAVFCPRDKERSLLFFFQTNKEGGEINKQFEQIIDSLRIY